MENVIIIGGGPAGLAASIYNARADLKPLVIAGSPPGGQLMLTTEVENYPGFESILGPDLIEKYRQHALKFGVRIVDKNVTAVDFSKIPFTISTPAVAKFDFYGSQFLRPYATFPHPNVLSAFMLIGIYITNLLLQEKKKKQNIFRGTSIRKFNKYFEKNNQT